MSSVLLEAACRELDVPVSQLPWICDEDISKITEFGLQGGELKCVEDVVALIDRRAQLAPGDAAVIYSEEQLTYGDLVDRSNHLARYLRELVHGGNENVGRLVTLVYMY